MLTALGQTFVAWIVIFPAIFGFGSLLENWIPSKDKLLRGYFIMAIGMAILSFLVVFLDEIDQIRSSAIWAMLIIGVAVFLKAHRTFMAWVNELGQMILSYLHQGPWGRLFLVLSVASVVILLMSVLTPEIGGDALCYHLNVPKLFLNEASLEPLPFDYNSYFPAFMYNLYLVGLATGGMFAAKVFHFLCGLLLFLILQRYLMLITERSILSIFAALGFLLTPGVYNQLSTSYVDVALGLYTTASVLILHMAFESRNPRAYGLAGFLIGCALSIKYLALMSGMGLAAMWLYHLVTSRFQLTTLRSLMIFCVGCFSTSFYWLLRNYLLKGNPFFPYFGEWFGGAQRPPQDYFDLGMGKTLTALPFVFWNMFVHPNAFGAFSNRIGILYLILFPFMLFSIKKFRKYGDYILFVTVFLFSWFYLVQADRWIYPGLPMIAVLGAIGLHETAKIFKISEKLMFQRIIYLLGLGLLGIYFLGGLYHYRYALKLYAGQTQSEYLTDMERTYPIADWVNQNVPEDAKILMEGEPSKFYFDREILPNRILKIRTNYDTLQWTVDAFHDFLKSHGITHVLASEPTHAPLDADATLVRKWASSQFAEKIIEMESKNIRDAKHRYYLYKLKT